MFTLESIPPKSSCNYFQFGSTLLNGISFKIQNPWKEGTLVSNVRVVLFCPPAVWFRRGLLLCKLFLKNKVFLFVLLSSFPFHERAALECSSIMWTPQFPSTTLWAFLFPLCLIKVWGSVLHGCFSFWDTMALVFQFPLHFWSFLICGSL